MIKVYVNIIYKLFYSDFSLQSWLVNANQEDETNIDYLPQIQLYDTLGITPYLLYPPCGTQNGTDTSTGWLNGT